MQVYCKSCKSDVNKDYEIKNPGRVDKLNAQKLVRRSEGQAYIRDYLETHPCVDCGESDWVVLEFDHVRGVKRNSVCILASTGHSLSLIISEIEKCEVRCCNCHRRVTYNRAGTWRAAESIIGE